MGRDSVELIEKSQIFKIQTIEINNQKVGGTFWLLVVLSGVFQGFRMERVEAYEGKASASDSACAIAARCCVT